MSFDGKKHKNGDGPWLFVGYFGGGDEIMKSYLENHRNFVPLFLGMPGKQLVNTGPVKLMGSQHDRVLISPKWWW